jgi:hypothetical protein
LLSQIALVTLYQRGYRHALGPGAGGGPALCGVEALLAGWYLSGYTRRLELIDCYACRHRAAAVLAEIEESGCEDQDTSEGRDGC